MPDISVIVFDGGPCAGKSTTLAQLQQELLERGLEVIVLPEAATTIQNEGFYPDTAWEESTDFQRLVLEQQLHQEELALKYLSRIQTDRRKVILCDRGAVSGEAYIGPDDFAKVAKSLDTDVANLSRRYDGVIHMRTAAIDAQEHYTLEHPARDETKEEARELDKKTFQAWNGHGTLKVIENKVNGCQISFDTKVSRAKRAVMQMLGIPEPIELERKYAVEVSAPVPETLADAGIRYTVVQITQYYLHTDGVDERRLRERIFRGKSAFYYAKKEETGDPEKRIEREKIITADRFEELYAERNLEYSPISKRRICFVYDGNYFKLDEFNGELAGYQLLEVEPLFADDQVNFPSFITVKQEVTDTPRYGRNSQLARYGLPE